jgi:phosphomannomutase
VVGRDGRPSGEWIEHLVTGTLSACGAQVRPIGMAPTPTVQLATEKSDAVGGISITASHNPSEWNGLKFLNREGIFLDADECEEFFQIVDSDDRLWPGWSGAGVVMAAEDALQAHIDAALDLPFVSVDDLEDRAFTVVVDAVNASGSWIVPRLLEHCGCSVVRLHCEGDGNFPHTPEPVPQNLGELCDAVITHHADLGIAVDPDADRLVLIDETGQPIGEEYTITQAVAFMLGWEKQRHPEAQQTVVVNLSTTRAVDDVAARYGARVLRTPVGEINVARSMKANGALIGGEGSGGVILSQLHYGRDSLAGIVITLQHLLEHGHTLSSLRGDLPEYRIVKRKAALAANADVPAMLKAIAAQEGSDARVTTDDGLKLDYENSWVHLRASNTEPIIRVIAEAPTEADAETLATRFMTIVEKG